MSPGPNRYTVREPARTPWEGVVLGWAAMVPIVAGAAGAWLLSGDLGGLATRLTLVWSGAVVTFLSGVRRGLSFRAPEGPTAGQIASFLWVFALGVLALATVPTAVAPALLALGFASIGVLDTMAARKADAPPYFARLRPAQMAVPTLALLVLLARQLA